jgi:hypothetical protein
MRMRIPGWLSAQGMLLGLGALCGGCTTPDAIVYQKESFGTTGVFSREYPSNSIATCEASRRALLSQGYIVADVKADLVNASKSFQPASDSHVEISFHVVCVSDGPEGAKSTVFVNALQDRYVIKKTNSSASVGVGAIGALSLPFGSSDDSLVKVSSETIPAGPLYDRFFGLTDKYLKQLGSDFGNGPPKRVEPPTKIDKPPVTVEKPHDAAPAPLQGTAPAPQVDPKTPANTETPSGSGTAAQPAPPNVGNPPAPELLGPVTTPS